MFDNTDLLHLYVNEVVIGPDTVLADLVECTLDNYAAKLLDQAWVPGIDPETNQAIVKYPINVTWPGLAPDGGPETIYGWYVTDTTGAILKLVGTLDTSIAVTEEIALVSVLVWLLLLGTTNVHGEEID